MQMAEPTISQEEKLQKWQAQTVQMQLKDVQRRAELGAIQDNENLIYQDTCVSSLSDQEMSEDGKKGDATRQDITHQMTKIA